MTPQHLRQLATPATADPPRGSRWRLVAFFAALVASLGAAVFFLATRPPRREPATIAEQQALSGYEARHALIASELAQVTSNAQARATLARLLEQATSIGWDSCALMESVKTRTGFKTPGLERNSIAWMEAAGVSPVSSHP
jgi:hypothetical protein